MTSHDHEDFALADSNNAIDKLPDPPPITSTPPLINNPDPGGPQIIPPDNDGPEPIDPIDLDPPIEIDVDDLIE